MKTQMTVLSFVLLSIFCLNAFAAESGLSTMSAPDRGNIVNDQKTGQFGAGIQVGSLTGVSGEYWLNNARALTASLTVNGGHAAVSLGHNWFARNAFHGSEAWVPFVGVQALAAFGNYSDNFNRDRNDFAGAIQVPVGIEFLPLNQRFGIFGEIAPSLEITPATLGFVTADAGARLYF